MCVVECGMRFGKNKDLVDSCFEVLAPSYGLIGEI